MKSSNTHTSTQGQNGLKHQRGVESSPYHNVCLGVACCTWSLKYPEERAWTRQKTHWQQCLACNSREGWARVALVWVDSWCEVLAFCAGSLKSLSPINYWAAAVANITMAWIPVILASCGHNHLAVFHKCSFLKIPIWICPYILWWINDIRVLINWLTNHIPVKDGGGGWRCGATVIVVLIRPQTKKWQESGPLCLFLWGFHCRSSLDRP